MLPVLLNDSETRTLKSNLKRRIDDLDNNIYIESWNIARMTNLLFLHETDLSHLVRERRLRLYGHVALYLGVNPAHRAALVRDHPA